MGDDERTAAFREVYDATYPRIMAYCLRRARDREDALDAVSETFATVWRRLDDLPANPRRVPWVYGVARRVLANQYRALGRKAELQHRLENEHRPAPHQDFDLVHQALEALRDADREILTLDAWDDLDNDEIAAVLGIPQRSVAVRLHRARKRLARELGRLGVEGPQKNSHRVKYEDRSRTPDKVNGTNPGPGEESPP